MSLFSQNSESNLKENNFRCNLKDESTWLLGIVQMEHTDTIHLFDRTDRGVNYNVTVQEINVIFSTFKLLCSSPSANSFHSLMTST